MGLPRQVELAINLCYDAAIASERWRDALDDLARALGADGCNLIPHDPAERPFDVLRSSHMDRFTELWERNHDWVDDVYAPRGAPLVRNGRRVLVQSQLFSDDEIRQSRFHQELSRPAGCLHWAASCFTVDDTAWCLPVFRGSEPFTHQEARVIAEVSQHLARIVTLAHRITLARAESEVSAFDKIGCAAMLADWLGRIIKINRTAEVLISPEFCVRNGKLWSQETRTRSDFERLLAGIRYGGDGVEMNVPPVIVYRDQRPWLLIEASPVTGVASDSFGGGRAILIISDLTSPKVSNAALIKLAFGLTAAEARLAAAICEGVELHAVAQKFGVRRETIRSQLRAIFGKTGVRRQAELVARLNSLRPLTPQ